MDPDIEATFREALFKSYEPQKRGLVPKEQYQNTIDKIIESSML